MPIAIARADGGVSIMVILVETTPEAELAKLQAHEEGVFLSCAEVDEIPSDKCFRDAWKLEGKAIVHDIAKCQDITKDRLRAERAPLLAALDVSYMRASEIGDEKAKAEIVAEKQRLRDITETVDLVTDLDQLKALSI